MTTNEMMQVIWDKGCDLKITSTEVRVFKTEYMEYLDLDTYNNIVSIEHKGAVLETIDVVLKKATDLLGAAV